MENISRGPIFGDFVTILTEGSMQDNTVASSVADDPWHFGVDLELDPDPRIHTSD